MKNYICVYLVLIVCLLGIHGEAGGLRKNFYKKTCPSAEEIVQKVTWKRVSANPTLSAKLLRMHFHDCIIRGCDASILINSTAKNAAEKDALPNLTLLGFDVIEEIKTQLEKECPGIVSCADILTLAARDSVSYQFRKPLWKVLTGRRDGSVSKISEATLDIPSPFANFTTLKKQFNSNGLTVHDLVVLSGAHSIGVGHCFLFINRLYNFTGKGDQDPSLDPTYAAFLKTKCKNTLTDLTTTVELDVRSSVDFDNEYYANLKRNKGLFQSDAALLTNKGARNIVTELLNSDKFYTEFAQSMKRLGGTKVLTGHAGIIRKKCSVAY